MGEGDVEYSYNQICGYLRCSAYNIYVMTWNMLPSGIFSSYQPFYTHYSPNFDSCMNIRKIPTLVF